MFDRLARFLPATVLGGLLLVLGPVGCDGLFADLSDLDTASGACDDDADSFGGGDGTAADPFRICTRSHFNDIGDDPSLMDAHFALHSDIDFDERIFTPIGSPQHPDMDLDENSGENNAPFNGTFDGNGHTIRGPHISTLDLSIGLFRHLGPDGEIFDLTVEDLVVSGSLLVGGLVGLNEGEISDCTIGGNSRLEVHGNAGALGGLVMGGLVAQNLDGGGISNCTAAVDVTGLSLIGGLVGIHQGVLITQSEASGEVITEGELTASALDDLSDDDSGAAAIAGGLVGVNESWILDSLATGDVTSNNEITIAEGGSGGEMVGGLVGANVDNGQIDLSIARGEVTASSELDVSMVGTDSSTSAGGFSGSNSGRIEDCYATGRVRIPDAYDNSLSIGGGLVGSIVPVPNSTAPQITNCYSTGPVSTPQSSVRGGLIGLRFPESDPPAVTNSYWDVDTSVLPDSDGGTGLDTDEFAEQGIFDEDWDFDSDWQMREDHEGNLRPHLFWDQ